MIDVIDAWLRLAADRIHEQASALTALDQAIGDGDHGTNMDRGFGAIRALLDAGRPEGEGPQDVAAARLKTAGRALISTVGGAAGPLYGTALMRAGTSVGDAIEDFTDARVHQQVGRVAGVVGQGFDRHQVSRGDGENRLEARVEVAPVDGRRGGRQPVDGDGCGGAEHHPVIMPASRDGVASSEHTRQQIYYCQASIKFCQRN